MSKRINWVYIVFMGGLTATAMTACKWQLTKYFRAVDRWKVIANELNNDQPTDLSLIGSSVEPYPFKYVKVFGELSSNHALINRPRGQRLGYLVMKVLKYKDKDHPQVTKEMIACDGWVPEEIVLDKDSKKIDLSATKNSQQYKGLLKKSEKLDYLHGSFDKQTLRKSGLQTYIDLQEVNMQLKMTEDKLSKDYYIEILKPFGDDTIYPIKYTKKDFELPYLTPAKHRDYATFWAGATAIGLFAIFRALKMR